MTSFTPLCSKAANDNNREPRRVLAWPTGKRLVRAKRHTDLQMLVDYRRLLDTAFGTLANDNWRNPRPTNGEEDNRSIEERVEQRDMIIEESLPTLNMLRELSGVPWKGDPDFDEARPARSILKSCDAAGVHLRQLGDLVFVDGFLFEYQNAKGRMVRPTNDLRRPRRPKPKAATAIVPSSGTWCFEDQIDAREQVRSIWHDLPASSIRILELALGTTTARELGGAFRKVGKTAERFGVRLIDRAVDDLRAAWRP